MNKQKEGKGKLQQEATLIVSSFLEHLPIKAHSAVWLCRASSSQGFSLKAQTFPRDLQKSKSLTQGSCRSSCSRTGQPWHCKQHEKPLSQTWKKAASGHRQGRTLGTERSTATEAEWEESNSRFKMQAKALEWQALEWRCSGFGEGGAIPENLLWIDYVC